MKSSEVIKKIRYEPALESIIYSTDNQLNCVENCGDYKYLNPNPTYPCKALSMPIRVQIQVTKKCVYKCKFCYDGTDKSKEELSDDEIHSLIDSLDKAGVFIVEWSGGEPLVRKHFFDLVEHAHSHGFLQCLLTNNYLSGIKNCFSEMANFFYCVQISLNSFGDDYDQLVGCKAWKRFVDNLYSICELKTLIQVTTIITNDSIKYLEKIARLCLDCGVREWRLGLLTFNGKSLTPWEEYSKVLDEAEPIVNQLRDEIGMRMLVMTPYDKIPIKIKKVNEWMLTPDYYINSGGKSFLYIDSFGDGYPFPLLTGPEFLLGSIKERTLKEMWFSDKLKPIRKATYEKTGCGGCKYLCAFWERSFVYSYFNDLFAPPPKHKTCWKIIQKSYEKADNK